MSAYEQLKDLVSKQVQLLQGNNSYPLLERDIEYKFPIKNTTHDKFHRIIQFWHKKLFNEEVELDEVSSPESKTLYSFM